MYFFLTSPFIEAVSMGRRNTKLEVYLQESQKLKSFASVESNGTLAWLGSDLCGGLGNWRPYRDSK